MNTINFTEVGLRIRDLRHSRSMTMEDLAYMTGVSKSTIKKWEDGSIQSMRTDKVTKVAAALGVTEGYLLGYDTSTPVEDLVIPEYRKMPYKIVKSGVNTVNKRIEEQHLYVVDEDIAKLIELTQDREYYALLKKIVQLKKDDLSKVEKAISIFINE